MQTVEPEAIGGLSHIALQLYCYVVYVENTTAQLARLQCPIVTVTSNKIVQQSHSKCLVVNFDGVICINFARAFKDKSQGYFFTVEDLAFLDGSKKCKSY